MKNTFILLIIFFTDGVIHAQGFFNQKGAWIKNQIKQIALCQVYIKDMEKGYDIAKAGLDAVGSIKTGDFHLHLDHFNSLLEINPAINKYANAAGVLLMQTGIEKLAIKNSDDYINAVFAALIEMARSDVDQLDKLLGPGNYAMTDNERIKNIDKLYQDMKDKYAFAQSFFCEVKTLTIQQLKEKNEVLTSRLLNNIKLP